MQLICSPHLDRTDAEAIANGYRSAPALFREARLPLLTLSSQKLAARMPQLIEWLVATRRLDVRIALFEHSFSDRQIYHEKLGIFQDSEGNYLAFSGSANESDSGLARNFEVVDVYRSWEKVEARRAATKRSDFDLLWHSETPPLEVLPFARAARDGRLVLMDDDGPATSVQRKHAVQSQQDSRRIGDRLEETIGIPGSLFLRPHQKRAIEKWFMHGGNGVLEMATGSGKTIVALAISTALYNLRGGPLVIVIVCPFLHLVHQWIEQAREFGLDPVIAAYATKAWHEELAARIYNAKVGQRSITSVVTTNATFVGRAFQEILRAVNVPFLFVADEVHNLGSETHRLHLPDNATYKLGLSATPERWFDDAGTDTLKAYFGGTVFRYTLEEGLNDKVLCPYKYFPILVSLTEEESAEYCRLTAAIAKLVGEESDNASSDNVAEALMLKRSRLVATASNKLPMLQETIFPMKGSAFNLIYCGDGTVESPVDEGIVRQIDAVVRMLGHECQMMVARYTADTEMDRRSELRQRFAEGVVQCLVAIRCLDEGVDIPETRRAFLLASSTNPRQFIQRRGRVLRRSPGKELAEIYDFIVQPPLEDLEFGSGMFNILRSMFAKELRRVIEFARLAQNGPEALYSLLSLRKVLHLLDQF